MKVFIGHINRNEAGIALVETLVAFGILSMVVVAFLSGLMTSLHGTIIAKEQGIAESLARSQLDYIKDEPYNSTTYSISPYLDLPEGWSLPAPLIEPVNVGLQKITVTPEHNGVPVFSISTYKMDRDD